MEEKVPPYQITQQLEKIGVSTRNQAYSESRDNGKALSLRARRFSSPECPPELLHYEIRPFGDYFNTLDISYSSACTWEAIQAFCSSMPQLVNLVAQSCGLTDTEVCIDWPRKLRSLNFARNQLTSCPSGVESLFSLQHLNLSGNRIESFDPTVLRLPRLEKLYLTGNPIVVPPKHIVQSGVTALREYCGISTVDIPEEVLPLVCDRSLSSPSSIHNKPPLSSVSGVHQDPSSLNEEVSLSMPRDLGYDSQSVDSEHCCELSQGSSDMDTHCDDVCACDKLEVDSCLPFNPKTMLMDYSCQSAEEICQVYTPVECTCNEVTLQVVKDTAFFPSTEKNEYLATPVVSVDPHHLKFPSNSPAVLVLPHCIDVSMTDHIQFIPLHSTSTLKQAPKWEVHENATVNVYRDCITLTTTHFSLFAVIVHFPYPSVSVEVSPVTGANISLPQLPGLKISVPPGALPGDFPVTLKTTVYYADNPLPAYHEREEQPGLASACIGLEPHGLQFSKPVSVCLPVQDFRVISSVHGGVLALWSAKYKGASSPLEWEKVDIPFVVREEEDGEHVACFSVSHFSFWKWMWNLPQSMLNAIRAGAVYTFGLVRTQCISIRCQVLMSPPIHDRTFGLAVAIYRFGEPLHNISNYKWILADSGESRRFLKTGTVEVVLTGNFEPISEFEENELRERFTFTGQDFCLEFALKLKESVTIPLQDHQVIGKLVLKEINGEAVTAVVRLNLIKVSYWLWCLGVVIHCHSVLQPQEQGSSMSSQNTFDFTGMYVCISIYVCIYY